MSWRFHIVDVFTTSAFAGNALAVLPDARGLTTTQMQAIAREINFSETTFVIPDGASPDRCRVRIFTPGAELDFAGHPTIGTACALAMHGSLGVTGRALMEAATSARCRSGLAHHFSHNNRERDTGDVCVYTAYTRAINPTLRDQIF